VELVRCPRCNDPVRAAGTLTAPPPLPKAGDVIFCLECGTVLVFSPDLRVRRATVNEIVHEELTSEEFREARRSITARLKQRAREIETELVRRATMN
jgi:hypothetical protein